MKYFAELDENNVVLNLFIADSLENAEELTGHSCIQYFMPSIGDSFLNGDFISPPSE